jgi:general stress protein 26
MQSNLESITTLQKKIEDVRIGMFTTVGIKNKLWSRPLTIQEIDKNGFLWFFVSVEADVSKQIQGNNSINVSFAKPSDSLYVSVNGTAEIIKDKEKIKSMWNPMVDAWFPGGIDNPHLALIKVDITSAEYWDSDKSKVRQLFKMAVASITGNAPTDIGKHKTISL